MFYRYNNYEWPVSRFIRKCFQYYFRTMYTYLQKLNQYCKHGYFRGVIFDISTCTTIIENSYLYFLNYLDFRSIPPPTFPFYSNILVLVAYVVFILAFGNMICCHYICWNILYFLSSLSMVVLWYSNLKDETCTIPNKCKHWKNITIHSSFTVPISNKKIVERVKINTSNTYNVLI